MDTTISDSHDLIVTIVRKGWSERVVAASKEAGAEGGTIIYGRGTGIHEKKKLLGICVEPEKEMILTLVPNEISDKVLAHIVKKCDLEKPGTGIGFVIDIKKVVGIVHLFQK